MKQERDALIRERDGIDATLAAAKDRPSAGPGEMPAAAAMTPAAGSSSNAMSKFGGFGRRS